MLLSMDVREKRFPTEIQALHTEGGGGRKLDTHEYSKEGVREVVLLDTFGDLSNHGHVLLLSWFSDLTVMSHTSMVEHQM